LLTTRQHQPVPVTILTGFLGSGKTTLLKRILSEQHGHKIAVIENELGEIGIDNEILVESTDQQIVVMNNGCICCTVRGDLSRILNELAEQAAAGKVDFTRVVIETTGVANPAPVAQTFFMDRRVRANYRLDGIITIVDAKHAHQQLDRHCEAQEQVGFGDRLLLSKTDLITETEEHGLRLRLARMNPRAQIEHVNFGEIGIECVLDINGFNLNSILDISPDFLLAEEAGEGHPHHPDHECHEHCGHKHDDEARAAKSRHDAINSFVLRSDKGIELKKFEVFLRAMMDLYAADMMRYKGIINFRNASQRFIFQGVHMVFGATPGKEWAVDEKRESKLVFIGRNLPKDTFEREFERCIASVGPD
jgi:G3E family GTPase